MDFKEGKFKQNYFKDDEVKLMFDISVAKHLRFPGCNLLTEISTRERQFLSLRTLNFKGFRKCKLCDAEAISIHI